eukprot:4124853-Amphidinium_carterae.2
MLIQTIDSFCNDFTSCVDSPSMAEVDVLLSSISSTKSGNAHPLGQEVPPIAAIPELIFRDSLTCPLRDMRCKLPSAITISQFRIPTLLKSTT